MKTLTKEMVTFTIETEEETTAIQHALSFKETGADHSEYIQKVLKDAENYNTNPWLWCAVIVTAKFGSLEGRAYLGQCAYDSVEDFKKGGYYEQMQDEAFQELKSQIDGIVSSLSEESKTYYYLLGESACNVYHEEGIQAVLDGADHLDIETCTFNPSTDHPSDLLGEAQGWMDFAEITEDEYKQIVNRNVEGARETEKELTLIKAKVNLLINDFLTDNRKDIFLLGLDTLNQQAKKKFASGDMWFRFPSDSTLATTIQNVESYLAGNDRTREHFFECLQLSKEGDFKIFYS